jgi:hypothetical protein
MQEVAGSMAAIMEEEEEEAVTVGGEVEVALVTGSVTHLGFHEHSRN